jgi:hypothetical protein
VVGVLAYVALLPIIMFTTFSVDSIPKWALKTAIVPIALIVFLVGRWIWKSAKRTEATAPVPSA